MPTPITINVRNMSTSNQNFYFFQQPAAYSGGPNVYTNSLLTQTLFPYSQQGSVLSFTLLLQFYAGVQQQITPPAVGQPTGQLAASQAIGLTPATGGQATNNTTTMTVSPSLGLSAPVPTQGPQQGSFRIITPVFDPTLKNYNVGSAVQTTTGGIVLSNFVTAPPNSNVDCQPILKFYVQTGTYTPGTVMNFTASSATAALCDATPGFDTFNVSYNSDGTWTVVPSASLAMMSAKREIESIDLNAEILNEAGTARVALGSAPNFNAPVTINNINNIQALGQLREYQVGPVNGPYVGRMCTQLNAGAATATFS